MAIEDATVVVVDDEQSVADSFALRLRLETEHDVRVAYGGREALDRIDDVDVVLLDRRMPDLSGDSVLNELRVSGFEGSVVMVTAVTPTRDVVELGFDDYLCKPVEKADLLTAIGNQLTATTEDDHLQEFLTVSNKLELLEAEYATEQLSEFDEYRRLTERAETLRARLAGTGALAEVEGDAADAERDSR